MINNPLRYTSTRAQTRRAARELQKRGVAKRMQIAQAERFSPANRAQRRALAKKLGFNWQTLQAARKAA